MARIVEDEAVFARASIAIDGRWTMREFSLFLESFRYAYASALEFEAGGERTRTIQRYLRDRPYLWDEDLFPQIDMLRRSPRDVGPRSASRRGELLDRLSYEGDLEVKKISYASPGWLEVVAKFNPLTVVVDFIKWWYDREDRRQTIRLSNRRLDLENDRLSLEAKLLENQIIKGRLDLLKEAGVSQRERRILLRRELIEPLRELDPYLNHRQLTGAELEIEPKKDDPEQGG
jgi:hypothetical protein